MTSQANLTSANSFKQLASKYIWWKTPDDSVAMPERVMAQVMNMGDYADVQALVHLLLNCVS